MRRTGISSKVPARREPKQLDYTPQPRPVAAAAQALPPAAPVVKAEYLRDTRLRTMCQQLPCQHCGSTTGSTWAHSNWLCHGKGKSIKASDIWVAALCDACHRELDQGSRMAEAGRWLLWLAAHVKTVSAAQASGLWPGGIEAPARIPTPGCCRLTTTPWIERHEALAFVSAMVYPGGIRKEVS